MGFASAQRLIHLSRGRKVIPDHQLARHGKSAGSAAQRELDPHMISIFALAGEGDLDLVVVMSNGGRFLLAGAPVLGVVFIAWAVIQGERAMLTARSVYLVLVPVSALGCLVAWYTNRVAARAPHATVIQAAPGWVVLKGVVQPLPDRAPLISSTGQTCVWFRFREKGQTRIKSRNSGGSTTRYESQRPFLLVDDTGKCLVLPEGADVSGGTSTKQLGDTETVIRPGDSVTILGYFQAAGAVKLPEFDANEEYAPVVVTTGSKSGSASGLTTGSTSTPTPELVVSDRSTLAELRERGEREVAERRRAREMAKESAPAMPRLPTISQSGIGGLFCITTGPLDSETGIYWLLKYVDLAVLIGAAIMLWRGSTGR